MKYSMMLLLTALISQTAFAEDYGSVDKLKKFVTRDQVITRLSDMEARGLQSHQIGERPWSDTFWEDYKGSIAVPYAEINFANFPLNWWFNWNSTFRDRDYLVHQHSDQLSDAEIGDLAPSEKLDLLVGDRSFTLTQRIMTMVKELVSRDHAATWSGICHGWAAASLNTERPLHSFTVTGAAGHQIKFYPADIKALLSFSWGKSYVQGMAHFDGGVCKTDHPARNSHGRVLDKNCFNVNPGFFHLMMVNQMGLNGRGMIMDREWAKTVQNQPFFAYSYHYFNPSKGDASGSLSASKIQLGAGYDDLFREFRSPRARSIVGVEAELQYGLEVSPEHHKTDGPQNDNTGKLVVKYDLELDEAGEIVGGEWHGDVHPDTVWLIPPDNSGKPNQAYSLADYDSAGNIIDAPWNGSGSLPGIWTTAAHQAAMNDNHPDIAGVTTQPQIPAMIIKSLLGMSRR